MAREETSSHTERQRTEGYLSSQNQTEARNRDIHSTESHSIRPLLAQRMLCEQNPEIEHFLTSCKAVATVREPIHETFIGVCEQFFAPVEIQVNLVQLILDPSDLLASGDDKTELDWHTKCLCQALHLERYKKLSLVSSHRTKVTGKRGCNT